MTPGEARARLGTPRVSSDETQYGDRTDTRHRIRARSGMFGTKMPLLALVLTSLATISAARHDGADSRGS